MTDSNVAPFRRSPPPPYAGEERDLANLLDGERQALHGNDPGLFVLVDRALTSGDVMQMRSAAEAVRQRRAGAAVDDAGLPF